MGLAGRAGAAVSLCCEAFTGSMRLSTGPPRQDSLMLQAQNSASRACDQLSCLGAQSWPVCAVGPQSCWPVIVGGLPALDVQS